MFHKVKTSHFNDQFIGTRVIIADWSKYHSQIGVIIQPILNYKDDHIGYMVNVSGNQWAVYNRQYSYI
jgi:hypothetical protein